MRKGRLMSAAERLGLLLPWLNDPGPPLAASAAETARWETPIRSSIARFLASFDGSPAAGYVEMIRREKGWSRGLQALAPDGRLGLERDDLLLLQHLLNQLLDPEFGLSRSEGDEQGLLMSPEAPTRTVLMPSLGFGVRNLSRGDLKLSAMSARERRAYTSAGAYVLQVRGTARDLVLYLTLQLLTAQRMAGVLARCPAPAPNNWTERCERWFLRTGHGRKREYCSDACRVRRHAEETAKRQKKEGAKR